MKKKLISGVLLCILMFSICSSAFAQTDTVVYKEKIKQERFLGGNWEELAYTEIEYTTISYTYSYWVSYITETYTNPVDIYPGYQYRYRIITYYYRKT